MVLADSNIWLALALSKHDFHAVVRAWFAHPKPSASVAFCRSTQQSFLRLLTTSEVFVPYGIPPLANKAAWSMYEGFLADRRITWLKEPRGLNSHWKKFAAGPKPSPKLWMDAYLAAFALVGGYQLATTDKAFKQFKGLDLVLLEKD